MRRICLLLLGVGLAATGCGYQDDNRRAAAIVAQAYLDAFTVDDAAAICRIAAPEVQVAFAAGQPSCEAGIEPILRTTTSPRLELGQMSEVENAPPGNPRFAVTVPAQPGRVIVIGRYGSIWRVVDGGRAG